MTQILEYGPDQLEASKGQWQQWQFSARQFMDQNKINLVPYLNGNWIPSNFGNIENDDPPYFYQYMDGSSNFHFTVRWNTANNSNSAIPLLTLNNDFWKNILSRYNLRMSQSTASLRELAGPGAGTNSVGVRFQFSSGVPINLEVENLNPAYTFTTETLLYVDLPLMPFFGG